MSIQRERIESVPGTLSVAAAEARVRAIQKEFLTRIEQHPVYEILPPDAFNGLRKRVFRGTFAAYRLGVVGIEALDVEDRVALTAHFYGWLSDHDAICALPDALRLDVTEMCLRTALQAFRVGALTARS